ncbi:MAG: hypothetical protein E6J91_03225 [Deltaproteobacteria bacterium]|nr:MAG: hypothetical protein E6J91_03225 [Deltaproteobacteria bacterium]
MSVFTVAIHGVSPDPEVYGGLDAATAYIGAMFGPAAAKWLALSPSDQGRTIRGATLYLEREPWEGKRTGLAGGTPTTLAWPRAGITLGDGTPLDAATVPVDIAHATFELAVLIAGDPALPSKVDQGSNLKLVGGAGVPTVEFFAPTSASAGTAPRLPFVVQQLVGKYLATVAASVEGGFGQAGSACSAFSRHRQFTLIHGEE